MKKLAVLLICCFVLSYVAFASDKSVTMKGWVSDAMCGAKTGEAHAACAKKCIDGGTKAVFVNETDQKVMQVANQDAIKSHAGEHVEVKGKVGSDGALTVDKVTTIGGK